MTVVLAGCTMPGDGPSADGTDGTDGDGGGPPTAVCADPDAPAPPATGRDVGRFVEVAGPLEQPVLVTHAGDDRLFIVEQRGIIHVWRNGSVRDEPFLDITDRTEATGEQGLLGLAFPDDFATSCVAYVSYTRASDGTSVLARYDATGNGSRLDPASREVLLTVDQPHRNHNGGHVTFGPDGYLYYGLGDGGSGGDPHGNGQNTSTLLGSILRLDVSTDEGYAIPSDNPFVGNASARDEIWAYGLRNPWRFSFDAATGDLWIGDVGQAEREEIDREPAGSTGGVNYGWKAWEGSHRYDDRTEAPGAVFPVAEYGHQGGSCSVTGGHVYRGDDVPQAQGRYLFADYCTGRIWTLQADGPNGTMEALTDTRFRITSFGVDAAGELYVVSHLGGIYRLVSWTEPG